MKRTTLASRRGRPSWLDMTNTNLDVLRVRYREACKAYRAHAKIIDESTKRGRRPLNAELRAEEQALAELTESRQELLTAISNEAP
jgi:hypothetical protein